MPWPKKQGAYLDISSKKLRLESLKIALENGRPLAVLDEFRGLIEGASGKGTLTDQSHMSKLIYLFGNFLDSDLGKKKFISLGGIFDGLSDDGEWVSVLYRGVEEGEAMTVIQGLLDMPHTSAPYNHAVLNSILIQGFTKLARCGPLTELLRFLMHDDAEVNNLSCKHLKDGLASNAISFSCIVHVLNRIGDNTFKKHLEDFLGDVLSLFKNAEKRKAIFRRLTKLAFPSINKIKACPIFI
jgi:hypothetical protein